MNARYNHVRKVMDSTMPIQKKFRILQNMHNELTQEVSARMKLRAFIDQRITFLNYCLTKEVKLVAPIPRYEDPEYTQEVEESDDTY